MDMEYILEKLSTVTVEKGCDFPQYEASLCEHCPFCVIADCSRQDRSLRVEVVKQLMVRYSMLNEGISSKDFEDLYLLLKEEL